ncbi:MAG: divergent PAP2 family protein [Cyanobacteria bacterium REEB67]|nr:divergent PAP2 family protein [Cyanobacteria bacterium REEB67]
MEFPIIDFLQNALTLAQNSGSSEQFCAVAQNGRGWQVVLVTVLSSGIAQSIKLFTKLLLSGQLDMRILAKTGGMPSSHSCCTMGMAVSVGLIDGFNSITFAIALCLAFIVMYDAAGVRRTVGLQAKVLNQIMAELFSEHPKLSGERIKEFLGHTPVEVFVGAILGSVIAVVFNILAIHQHWHVP